MKSVIALIAMGSTFAPLAWATKSLDFTIHQEYTSTRALGLGNAFTAVADDHSGIFYNPASLARRTDGQVRMFLRGGMDDGVKPLYDDIKEAGKKPSEAEQIDAYSALIEKNYGEHFYFRAPTLGAVWVRPRWGIAFIPADFSLDIAVHQQIGPTLNINGYLDTTLAYGYARDVKWFAKRDRFSVGANIKGIHRVHVGEALLAAELAADNDIFDMSDANEGFTVDMDIGSLYTWNVGKSSFFKPTVAMVVRNVFDYGFTTNFHMLDKNSGTPPKLNRRIDLGSKFDLPKFWVFDPHLSLDVRDMLHPNWTPKKGAHAGAELYWKMYNWWKGYWALGMNQGYWTAGFGARLAFFQLDIASFGEEVGTSSVPKESRRFMLEMSLEF